MLMFRPTKVVKKSMVGRPGDFLGFDGNVYNGRLAEVRNGYATFLYHVPGHAGEFRTVVRVREKRLEIF